MSDRSRPAPYAYDGLDRIFHEKARLGIVTSLVSQGEGLGFSELKALCGLTDGNLSRHLQVSRRRASSTSRRVSRTAAPYELPADESGRVAFRRLSRRAPASPRRRCALLQDVTGARGGAPRAEPSLIRACSPFFDWKLCNAK